tara:strand:+ start:403 stop:1710 length:1308 start_codon:yes stop_codon:yes gene_type:complete
MTTIPDFDIATDLKVEFFLPNLDDNAFIVGISLLGGTNVLSNGGQFIIGESLLGGEDVLGGLGFTWQNLGCTTANAQLSVGGSVQDDLYFQAQPANAKLTLQTYQYDPSLNSAFRPGVPVRIRLEKDPTDQIIWSGVVDTIGARYTIDGKNLMSVVAYDDLRNLLNTRIASFDSTTVEGYVTPYEQMSLIAAQFGTSMHSTSVETSGQIPSQVLTNVIPNGLVFDAIQVGQALFWLDPATQEFVFVPRPDASVIPDFPVGAGYFTLNQSLLGGVDVLGSGNPVYTVGNNHEVFYHLCMTNIDTLADGDSVFNSLKVTLKDDNTTSVLVENEDSISLYGRYAQDVILNTTTEAELTRWANSVFNQSPTNLVQSVETLTKDRAGTITEAAFLLPGELLGVDFEQDILHIKDYYTITKVSHYIDPDNWLTTLDLWKEA